MKLLSIKLKVGQSDFPPSVKLVSNSWRGDVHHHPVGSCDASQCFDRTKTPSSQKRNFKNPPVMFFVCHLNLKMASFSLVSSALARHAGASCLRLLFLARKVFYWSLARKLKYLQSGCIARLSGVGRPGKDKDKDKINILRLNSVYSSFLWLSNQIK